MLQANGDHAARSSDIVLFVLWLWIVPVMAVYALGLGVAWVGRGFQRQSQWLITREP